MNIGRVFYSAYLFEGPFLVLEEQADFVGVLEHLLMKDVGHSSIGLGVTPDLNF
jgi:hypothetical protein